MGVVILTLIVLAVAVALAIAHHRLRVEDDALVLALDALLPQTQCAQCGYPGCRPYAAAMASGAPIDLCPPGGEDTVIALAELLPDAQRQAEALEAPETRVAVIDETRCIGCYLCIEACPVDAIIGAPKYMHTVMANSCTGCELCLPPCPVDCISLRAP